LCKRPLFIGLAQPNLSSLGLAHYWRQRANLFFVATKTKKRPPYVVTLAKGKKSFHNPHLYVLFAPLTIEKISSSVSTLNHNTKTLANYKNHLFTPLHGFWGGLHIRGATSTKPTTPCQRAWLEAPLISCSSSTGASPAPPALRHRCYIDEALYGHLLALS
jgi:hypothetical protein